MSDAVKQLGVNDFMIDGATISLRERDCITYSENGRTARIPSEALVRQDGENKCYGTHALLSYGLKWSDGTLVGASGLTRIRQHLVSVNNARGGWLEIDDGSWAHDIENNASTDA